MTEIRNEENEVQESTPPTEPSLSAVRQQNWLYYAAIALLIAGGMQFGGRMMSLNGRTLGFQADSGWTIQSSQTDLASLKVWLWVVAPAITLVAGFGLLRRFRWAVSALWISAVIGLLVAAIQFLGVLNAWFERSRSEDWTAQQSLAFLIILLLPEGTLLILPALTLAWIRRAKRHGYLASWCHRSGAFSLRKELWAARTEVPLYEAADSILCRKCQYPLWHLPGRTCPECGEHFKCSEYLLVPNSVRFCCPHCSQSYYGTDPRGHLTPRTFICAQCNHPIDLDNMVICPLEDKSAGNVGERTPWLDRQRIGRLRAWCRTFKLSLFNPARLAAGLRPDRQIGASSLFEWWQIMLAVLLTMAATGLSFLFVGEYSYSLSHFIYSNVLSPFLLIYVALLLCGLWVHLLLVFTGKNRPSLAGTFESVRYASGPLVLAFIFLAADKAQLLLLWWLTSTAFVLRQTHQLTFTRSIFVVFAPPLISMIALRVLALVL